MSIESNLESELETEGTIILVVPCFNEEIRWSHHYWEQICAIQNLRIFFVNDGSTDGTSDKISKHLGTSNHELLELPENLGKAEAIRNGINHVLNENCIGVGYLDADGAFPIQDIKTQIDVFKRFVRSGSNPPAVWSSRVQLAGRAIERDILRHYFARILVTFLALRLKFSVYDPQSGMKIFPPSKTLEACLNSPFKTHWFVDLEIFLRWRRESGANMKIWEEPLLGWKDVKGSKLTHRQYWTVLTDIVKLNSYGTSNQDS